MGGDDSQKLLPWRGAYSSPGRKPPAHCRINNVTETAVGISPVASTTIPRRSGCGLNYRPPGSFFESRGGSVLERAEAHTQPNTAKRFSSLRYQHRAVAAELVMRI